GASLAGAPGVLAEAHWRAGRLGEGLHLAREAVKRADGGAAVPWHAPARLPLAAMLTHLRQTAEAAAAVDALADEIARRGAPVLRGVPLILGSCLALARGALTDAVTRAGAGLAIAEEAGMPLYAPLGWAVLVEAALRRGDLAGAEAHARRLAAAAE
ncbi:hypothetical protein RKE29_30420, partial [Streptomyces sp. B1866]|nr:hypothetical protein [Streptomyces sp. B1866]